MPRKIVPQFERFAAEGAIIGRLVTGYGSLESTLSSCVGMAKQDVDTVIKTMFRARGETQRIDIADAIGRPLYRRLRFEDAFSEAIADMRFCLKIRNQYAHCEWHDDQTGQLCFINMEEIAKPHTMIENLLGLTFHYLDIPPLEAQEAYFVHVADRFLYLNYEGRKRAGVIPVHGLMMPKKMRRPLLHLPISRDDQD